MRAIRVELADDLDGLDYGWNLSPYGKPICKSPEKNFLDATIACPVEDWPLRTTLICNADGSWQLVELLSRLTLMEDRCSSLDTREPVDTLTILADDCMATELMGFKTLDPEVEIPEKPMSKDQPDVPEIVPQAPEDVNPGPGDGPEPQSEEQQIALKPNLVEILQHDDSLEVAGVHLSASSGTGVLREACKTCGVSSSGSKQKLFNRLRAFYDRQQIEMTAKIAQQAQSEAERAPNMQVIPNEPSEIQIALRNLTHSP